MSKQLGASLGFRNILWKAIVKQKVLNQDMTLETLGIDGSALIQLAREVRSGDPSNREALAAKTYFPLLKPGYTRETICPLTSALNYGYAAVRSTLARHVVSHGFITSVGFHHSNDRNEFNLVDDLVEPFRAIVDLHVMNIELAEEDPANLSCLVRKQIAGVLRRSCEIGGSVTSVLTAAEECVESLNRALEAGDAGLVRLPKVISAGDGTGEF